MSTLLVKAVIILFLWYAGWSILDIATDDIAGDNVRLRFAFNIVLLVLALFVLWIVLSIEGLIT